MSTLPPESRDLNVPGDALLAALRVAFAPESGDAPRGRVSVRYDVREEIAHGGMGIVWRGFDLELAREVAIKTLQPGLDAHDGMALRFANEARITGRLQHPGIVPVYEHGRLPDGRPFLTMKLIGGETLRALLDARGAANDRRRWLSIFEQVVQTLGYAHSEGIVHRDLKPANVMVGAFGEVQVVDWGLALDLHDGPSGRGVVGTRGYMAPEQERGEPVDARADVWALGTILRELVAEHPDPALLALIEACCAEDKEQRPASAGELTRRLSAYLSAFDARARKAEERRRTRPLRLSLATAILLVLALGTLGVVRAVTDRRTRSDRELIEKLDDLQTRWGERGDMADFARDDADFARAFREYAVDVDAADEGAVIAALRGDRLVEALVQALDYWAIGRRRWQPTPEERWRRLVAVANAIDPDARGRAVREAVSADDLPRLRDLAAASETQALAPGTWVVLGNALGWLGDARAATAALERAWSVYPGDFWVCYKLARWSKNLEPPREDESLRFFTAAVALRPGSAMAHSDLATALVAHQRIDEGVAEYRRAIELRPRNALLHQNLAWGLRLKDDLPGAIEACRAAVQLAPNLTNAWLNLGTMLSLEEDRPAAIECFRKALALRPDEPRARYILGMFLREEDRIPEAIAELREVLRIAPEHARANAELGMCLLAQGTPRPALEHLRKGRELATTDADWDSEYDGAIAKCKQMLALESRPENERDPKALVALGRRELERKDAKKALELFAAAFAQDPALCDDLKLGARHAAARAAALCGERAKALEWLRQDLVRWADVLTNGTPAGKRAARTALTQWQKDPDLASLRTDEIWKRVTALLEGEQK